MKLERITYDSIFDTFEGYHKISVDFKLQRLLNIAVWRNEVLASLRSTDPTPLDVGHQINWIRSFDLVKDYYFFITLEDTIPSPMCVGYCGLDKVDRYHGTAEMSLLINPTYHKHGVGSEAVEKLLEYGFKGLELNCIYIECYTTTTNWVFWKKIGFKEEGRLRRRKYWEGKYYDSIVASITKEEWKEKYNVNKT